VKETGKSEKKRTKKIIFFCVFFCFLFLFFCVCECEGVSVPTLSPKRACPSPGVRRRRVAASASPRQYSYCDAEVGVARRAADVARCSSSSPHHHHHHHHHHHCASPRSSPLHRHSSRPPRGAASASVPLRRRSLRSASGRQREVAVCAPRVCARVCVRGVCLCAATWRDTQLFFCSFDVCRAASAHRSALGERAVRDWLNRTRRVLG
jgi:hypothetical protein